MKDRIANNCPASDRLASDRKLKYGIMTTIGGVLWLWGCAMPGEPYVLAQVLAQDSSARLPESTESSPMVIRYSRYWNSPEQVLDLVRELCGNKVSVAYVIERPYRGSLLHPQELDVLCESDPGHPVGTAERDDGFWLWLAELDETQ